MALHAIAAARRAVQPVAALAVAPETAPAMAAVTREAGMRGWEGELCRLAEGASLEDAVRMLPWWSPTLARAALATGRARPGHHDFLARAHEVEANVAVALLGNFPHLEALALDLEWLAVRVDPEGRPRWQAAMRRGLPDEPAPKAVAAAAALHQLRQDCEARAWSRLGLDDPLQAMVLDAAVRQGADDPAAFGWDELERARAATALEGRGLLDGSGAATPAGHHLRRDVDAEADALAADPWETMTESRRTRALGVIEVAADHVGALPRVTG